MGAATCLGEVGRGGGGVPGQDTPERALRDAELRAGSWGIWVRREYVPTIEALRRKDWKRLLSLVFERVERDCKDAVRRGETTTFDEGHGG